MISLLRKNFGKKLLLAIVWLTIFSLGGMALISFVSRTSLGRAGGFAARATVGEVNGYEITPLEYQRKVAALEHYYSALRQQFGENAQALLTMLGMKGAQESAMRELVSQKLLLSAANNLGIELSSAYVSKKLSDPLFTARVAGEWVPAHLLSQSGVKYDQLVKTLQRQGISPAVLEDVVEERIKGALLLSIAQSAAYVPEPWYEESYSRETQQKKFSVMKISLAPYLKAALAHKASEESLRQFFSEANARSRHYWKKPQGKSSKVEQPVEQPFEAVRATVEKDYYRAQAAQRLAADLELLKPMSDASRAGWAHEHKATVSTTPWVAAQGAEYTKLSAEGLPVERMVAMTRAGEVLTALIHEYGYVIILKELAPFDAKVYEAKKDALKNRLLREEAGRIEGGFIASLEKHAKIRTNKSLTH